MPTHQLVFACAVDTAEADNGSQPGELVEWARGGFGVAEICGDELASALAARVTAAGMMPVLAATVRSAAEVGPLSELAKRTGALAVCVSAGIGTPQPDTWDDIARACALLSSGSGAAMLLDVAADDPPQHLERVATLCATETALRLRLDVSPFPRRQADGEHRPLLARLLDRVDMLKGSGAADEMPICAEVMRLWRRRTPPGRWMVFAVRTSPDGAPGERIRRSCGACAVAATAWKQSATATPLWP